MTKEQKKAELLHDIVHDLTHNPDERFRWVIERHDAIESEKPLSKDLYADEVFVGNCGSRIINAALDILNHGHGGFTYPPYERKNLRLSMLPNIEHFRGHRGISKKSLWVYETVMRENGFEDKLL